RKAGGAMAETAWELAELFVLRPVLAIFFALSFILLSTYGGQPPFFFSRLAGFLIEIPQAGMWRGGRCWRTSRSCRRSPACAGTRSPPSPSLPTAAASAGSTSRKRKRRGERSLFSVPPFGFCGDSHTCSILTEIRFLGCPPRSILSLMHRPTSNQNSEPM
uniref:Uncharacterized protein n=1 Tax=Aegilops tauschii subsp. strangulata TaxID=200361 RepID=A0A453DZ93_AEGTS